MSSSQGVEGVESSRHPRCRFQCAQDAKSAHACMKLDSRVCANRLDITRGVEKLDISTPWGCEGRGDQASQDSRDGTERHLARNVGRAVTITVDVGLLPDLSAALRGYVAAQLDAERRSRRDLSRKAFNALPVLGLAQQLDDAARDHSEPGGGGRDRPESLPMLGLVPLREWCAEHCVPERTARRYAIGGQLPGAMQAARGCDWYVPRSVQPPQRWSDRKACR
jgi:hypothetical protein